MPPAMRRHGWDRHRLRDGLRARQQRRHRKLTKSGRTLATANGSIHAGKAKLTFTVHGALAPGAYTLIVTERRVTAKRCPTGSP